MVSHKQTLLAREDHNHPISSRGRHTTRSHRQRILLVCLRLPRPRVYLRLLRLTRSSRSFGVLLLKGIDQVSY